MLAISCAHFRRNRAAVVHSVIQPFFQRRSAPADGNAARDDLPVCDESLRAMAKACVGRRTTDDALHSGLEYARPLSISKENGYLKCALKIMRFHPSKQSCRCGVSIFIMGARRDRKSTRLNSSHQIIS